MQGGEVFLLITIVIVVLVISNNVIIQWLHEGPWTTDGEKTALLPIVYTTTYCVVQNVNDYTNSSDNRKIRTDCMLAETLSSIKFWSAKGAENARHIITLGY